MLKYSVDGGMEPTASGASPQQAAHDAHVGFCTFLAAKSLHVDVWDGESLLQVCAALQFMLAAHWCRCSFQNAIPSLHNAVCVGLLLHGYNAVDCWCPFHLFYVPHVQVGSVAVDLQAMLRQGRDFSELLLELPVMDQAAIAPGLQGQTFLDATTAFNPGTGALA